MGVAISSLRNNCKLIHVLQCECVHMPVPTSAEVRGQPAGSVSPSTVGHGIALGSQAVQQKLYPLSISLACVQRKVALLF